MSAGVNTAISGAREGLSSGLGRLLARAAARELSALVVPGPEVARAAGLDLEAAGLSMAAGPRRASVLVALAPPEGLPEGLERAAEVVYSQMPRPRATLVVGAGAFDSLPADARCEPDQLSLAAAAGELRRAFREGAFAGQTQDFEAPALETRTIYTCSMHPEIEQEEPGQCPECGMDLIPKESTGESRHDHGGHDTHGHGGHGHEESEHDEHAGEGGHGGHEEMDFMSMVEMTQGTPRSSDGLQMEWVEAAFGPLLPGLPGGFSLSLTLDGDTVAEAEAAVETGGAGSLLHGSASGLAGRLSRLDPLSPFSYRLLATLALEEAAGRAAPEDARLARLAALELERAASHAGWLADFCLLLGIEPLRREAERLELDLRRPLAAGPDAGRLVSGDLHREAASLARRVSKTRLLGRRLRGVGVLGEEEAARAGGPLARAAGIRSDLRGSDADYARPGFEPVVESGGDAFARLRVRLAEIEQSLRLARDASQRAGETGYEIGAVPRSGAARVETPRGAAALSLSVEGGEISEASLETPSEAALALVRTVAEGRELGDALVGVASLDISPWRLG